MKTFIKYSVVSAVALVAVLFVSRLQAEGLRHVVWQTPGTNINAISTTDATSNPIIANSVTGKNRWFSHIENTNTTSALLLRLSGTFPNAATNYPDICIAPNSAKTVYFGEGYNGAISARSGSNYVDNFIYSEGGN